MDIYTTYFYQPFFNLLIGLYYVVGKLFENPDMGITMIFFAVAVRLIFLPIDLYGDRSEEDKLEISEKIKKLKIEFASDPVRQKAETKRIMRTRPGAIISEIINTVFQVVVIFMLYRIFTTGLEGADLHLIYKFMPKISTPINLMFLGKYDLSHTNTMLNIIQSVMISLNEALHLYFSPIPPSRKDFISLVIIFPIMCFGLFLFLPAGKKVYIITSLTFTIIVRLIKQTRYLLLSLSNIPASNTIEDQAEPPVSTSS